MSVFLFSLRSFGKSNYIQKTAAEALVLSSNAPDFRTCALRPAPVFGPNDPSCIPTIYACISKFETPFIVGSGLNLSDFVYVSNVADAHVLAVKNLVSAHPTAAGQTFFISNGEPVPFRDFCLAVWKGFGHIPPFQIQIPKGLAWTLGCLAECMTWVMGTQATLSRGSVKDACAIRYANLNKARRLLGYVPRIGLEEGIKEACQVGYRFKFSPFLDDYRIILTIAMLYSIIDSKLDCSEVR